MNLRMKKKSYALSVAALLTAASSLAAATDARRTQMHKAASQFALVAQETGADGNTQRAVAALSKITEQCVACHAAYRAH